MILDTLTWPVLIMMLICIGIAPIFAGEYQSKCDSLISVSYTHLDVYKRQAFAYGICE